MDRGEAASTPPLPDPTEAHWDGRRLLLEEVGIITSWCFYDPLGPRRVRVLCASLVLATVHSAHPDADLSEDRYGGQHPLVERGVVARWQQLQEPPVFVDILVVRKATSHSRRASKFCDIEGHIIEGRVVPTQDVDQHEAGAYPPACGAEVVIPLGGRRLAEGERIPAL